MAHRRHVDLRPADYLDAVLIFKMLLTVGWAGALLLAKWSFKLIGIRNQGGTVFPVLLGGAYSALFVGYALGYYNRKRSLNIRSVVVVGIVSNGLACLILLAHG